MLCLGFRFLVYVLKDSASPSGGGVSRSPLSLVLCDGVVFHVRLQVMCFNVICKLEVLLCITQERLVSVLMS